MRCLYLLAALPAFALSSSALAADQPALSELTSLLTQSVASDAVQALVKKYDLREGHKFDSGSFTAKDEAYTLMFRHNRIDAVILRASPWPKGSADANWTTYSNPLPRNLKATDSRKDVEKKLGKPTKPDSDRWTDKTAELWIHFDERGDSIEEVWVSAPNAKP